MSGGGRVRPKPAGHTAGLLALMLAHGVAWAAGTPEASAASVASVAAARPQLSGSEAAKYRVEDYLAQGAVPWRPVPLDAIVGVPAVAGGTATQGQGSSPAPAPADFVVAANGRGTHTTLQAAIDAVPPRGDGTRRWRIRIEPGVYRERVCILDKAPLAIFGAGTGAGAAAAVRIVFGRYNAQPRSAEAGPPSPCDPQPAASPTFGTADSASVVIASDDVQLAQLTIANDAMDAVRAGQGYPEGVSESGGAQAVALSTRGDRIQLEAVQLLGHQDTFHAARRRAGVGAGAGAGADARVLVRGSLIAGDVDFVFGDAVLVIERSTLLSRAGRRTPGHGGHVLAPSTPAASAYGFLVHASRWAAEPGVAAASISLGRAWDHGVARGEWKAGVSPNGQALVRDSVLGAHLAPWSASTSRRPFSATGEQANRFAEFRNVDEDALARAVLPAGDGWAAAQGGTRGGADALPADVFEVRTRRELLTAVAESTAPGRPRLIKLLARIDLAADDAGRPLGAEAFRDPDFDWAAFERAYDPQQWGRQPPAGPLEDARRRSAARQAQHIVVKLPSRTTLVGVMPGAGLVGGMLQIEGASDVIVRHLHFADAYDHFPAWDPNDNAHGEWNSLYDTLQLRGATRVWIDHCSFDDGAHPDASEPVRFGRPMQRHDGLLDIVHASDLITVSWNRFASHDKTSLVGGSDAHRGDAEHLRVSFHHNLWDGVKERAPRVRYGQVHLANNLHRVTDARPEAYGYSIGVGLASRVFSERNVWLTPDGIEPKRLVRWLGGSAFSDRGSLLNGREVDLLSAVRAVAPAGREVAGDVGWEPPYKPPLDAATDVAARVLAGAGAWRW